MNPFKSLQLKVSREAALVPNCSPLLEVALLTGDVASGSDVARAGSDGKVGLDEDLIVQQLGRSLALKVFKSDVVH